MASRYTHGLTSVIALSLILAGVVSLLPASVTAQSECDADCCYQYDASREPFANPTRVTLNLVACSERYTSQALQKFDFQRNYWDDGMGISSPCNLDAPFHRMLKAIFILLYASPNYVTSVDHNNGPPLQSGGAYAATHLVDMQAQCYDPEGVATARTQDGFPGILGNNWSGWVGNEWTKFFWPFFYDREPPIRASIVFHEAIHAAGISHDTDAHGTEYQSDEYGRVYLAMQLCASSSG